MTEHSTAASARASAFPMLEEATPPLSPAPMPRQTLVFWTPRLVLAATLHSMMELRRPLRIMQRATISVPNADEPR
jgi:hypothetical protein